MSKKKNPIPAANEADGGATSQGEIPGPEAADERLSHPNVREAFEAASEVLGEQGAREWLLSPCDYLFDRTPADAIVNDDDLDEVLKILEKFDELTRGDTQDSLKRYMRF